MLRCRAPPRRCYGPREVPSQSMTPARLEHRLRKLSTALIRRLNLTAAIEAEAVSRRNLLPDEPTWDVISSHATELADYLSNRLRAGFHPASEVEIAARKPAHGVRPLPYWGTLERVVYRALADEALSHAEPLDRSPDAYIRFITAPGRYARDRQPGQASAGDPSPLLLGGTPVRYVVKSDLAAFYQFIDHAVLADELLLLGVDFELIEALIELLAEVQGRNYGLPQLLDASDMLSDLYADRIERELLRSGYAVWRFNDDFRVACDTYAVALAAIEDLDAAARRVGLALSDSKTVTVGIFNYIFDSFGLSQSESGQAVNVDNVEDVVGDYTDDFGEADSDNAYSVIQSAQALDENIDGGINLSRLSTMEVRVLRRAVNGLAVAADPRAISDVVRLAIYAPSLTPNLMRYIRGVGEELDSGNEGWNSITETVDRLMDNVSLNAWQMLWLVDVIRDLKLLKEDRFGATDAKRRAAWVDDLRRDAPNEVLRAFAIRALAAEGLIDLTSVIAAAERASDALLHVYASAARERLCFVDGPDTVGAQKAVAAWAGSSKLHACLLEVS